MIEKPRLRQIVFSSDPAGRTELNGTIETALFDKAGNLVAIKPGQEHVGLPIDPDAPALVALKELLIAERDRAKAQAQQEAKEAADRAAEEAKRTADEAQRLSDKASALQA